MAMRVKKVTKAQKDQGNCQVCGKAIKAGDPYKWAKGFRGPKYKRCDTCPTWKASELETGNMADAIAAQEAADDALSALDFDSYTEDGKLKYESLVEDLKVILQDCANEAESSRDAYQESLDNMPEGLQQGDTGQMIQEKIDYLEDWFSTLEDWSPDTTEPEGDDLTEEDFDVCFTDMVEEARTTLYELEA